MASNITPGNIDGTYPIAGIDNDSQGFRTNFTNTSTNLSSAKAEIEDLQNKAILKAPLAGEGSTNNDMLGAILKSTTLVDTRESIFQHGTLSGVVILNHQNGHYQTVTTAGNITFSMLNFPGSGGSPVFGRVKIEINVVNTNHSVALPSNVTNGIAFLDNRYFRLVAGQSAADYNGIGNNGSFQGGDDTDATAYVGAEDITLSDGTVVTVGAVDGNGDVTAFTLTPSTVANALEGGTLHQVGSTGSGTKFSLTPGPANQDTYVIKFNEVGVYTFEFSTYDSVDYTVDDITRSNAQGKNTPVTNAKPSTSIGKAGDKSGAWVYNKTFLYICIADYDGATHIWRRVLMDDTAF